MGDLPSKFHSLQMNSVIIKYNCTTKVWNTFKLWNTSNQKLNGKIVLWIKLLPRAGELTANTHDRARPLWAAVTESRSSTTMRPVNVTATTAIISIRNVNHRIEERKIKSHASDRLSLAQNLKDNVNLKLQTIKQSKLTNTFWQKYAIKSPFNIPWMMISTHLTYSSNNLKSISLC